MSTIVHGRTAASVKVFFSSRCYSLCVFSLYCIYVNYVGKSTHPEPNLDQNLDASFGVKRNGTEEYLNGGSIASIQLTPSVAFVVMVGPRNCPTQSPWLGRCRIRSSLSLSGRPCRCCSFFVSALPSFLPSFLCSIYSALSFLSRRNRCLLCCRLLLYRTLQTHPTRRHMQNHAPPLLPLGG